MWWEVEVGVWRRVRVTGKSSPDGDVDLGANVSCRPKKKASRLGKKLLGRSS